MVKNYVQVKVILGTFMETDYVQYGRGKSL
jgi:hypothetical protein